MSDSPITLTEAAALRVRELIEADGNAALKLRLGVSGGGCSGFQYVLGLDERVGDDDTVLHQHGVDVVVDEMSLSMLAGTEVDYVEDLMGATFQIHNPNATSSCGCGNSFSC